MPYSKMELSNCSGQYVVYWCRLGVADSDYRRGIILENRAKIENMFFIFHMKSSILNISNTCTILRGQNETI